VRLDRALARSGAKLIKARALPHRNRAHFANDAPCGNGPWPQIGGMPNPQPEPFDCRNCRTRYELVRVEAEPPIDEKDDLTCLSCGAPLLAREGRYVLKYFFTAKSAKRMFIRRKGRSYASRS